MDTMPLHPSTLVMKIKVGVLDVGVVHGLDGARHGVPNFEFIAFGVHKVEAQDITIDSFNLLEMFPNVHLLSVR